MGNFPLKPVQDHSEVYNPAICNLNSNHPQLHALHAYSPAITCSSEAYVKQLPWQ